MAVQHSRKTAKTFIGELYEDDPSMQYAIEYLKTGAFSCCYIWHDKDVNESGLPKKKHLHFVLKYPCKTNISVIAKLLQIADNYIDTCNNETKSLLYLIYRGYEDKYQNILIKGAKSELNKISSLFATDCYKTVLKNTHHWQSIFFIPPRSEARRSIASPFGLKNMPPACFLNALTVRKR